MVCLLFGFWLLWFIITGLVIKIVFTLILELFFTFTIHFILNLYIFITVFIKNLAIFFRNVLYILLQGFINIYNLLFVFFVIILLICILVNLLHVFKNNVNLFYILFSRSARFNVDKDITHTVLQQSNTTSLELWIILQVTFFFLQVLRRQEIDKKAKRFASFFNVYDLFVS